MESSHSSYPIRLAVPTKAVVRLYLATAFSLLSHFEPNLTALDLPIS